MADIDIDPLVIMIRQTHSLMKRVKLSLLPQEEQEDLLWNQNEKSHLEK